MAYGLRDAILFCLLSGLGHPVYDERSKQNNPKPVKIVVECKSRDITDEEENKDVLNESKNL